MKFRTASLLPFLFLTGCVGAGSHPQPMLHTAAATHHAPHNVPAELLRVWVTVDGQRVGAFDAEIVSPDYATATDWHRSDASNEVCFNYGQSDHYIIINVRSVAPSQTFVATSRTVAANTLPPTPFIFNLKSQEPGKSRSSIPQKPRPSDPHPL